VLVEKNDTFLTLLKKGFNEIFFSPFVKTQNRCLFILKSKKQNIRMGLYFIFHIFVLYKRSQLVE